VANDAEFFRARPGAQPFPQPGFIAQQMRVVLRDIGADAIKTGMLHDAATIDTVADILESEAAAKGAPVVVDPVMFAKGGHPLLQPEAVATLTLG
jgi:hydroxymethylpyrimidine/phosphomethylpyrimidine kinase